MSIGLRIVITLLLGSFSVLIFVYSLELTRTKSFRAKLEEYEKNPESRTFMRKWFYGWFLGLQRNIHRSITEGGGDKVFTSFLRVAGVFFLVFSVAVLFYLVWLWAFIPYSI